MQTLTVDVAVIGGGMGGVAAALALIRSGKKVLLSEESPWIGGQATNQGVPPDEHMCIESEGCTALYRSYRQQVRSYYRQHYPLTDEAMNDPKLNPGGGTVSAICHEPKVSARVMTDMLSAAISSGQLILLQPALPVTATCLRDEIKEITLDTENGQMIISADYFLDATECGDLLPMTDTAYRTGSEARSETGEKHAADKADPLDMQAVTWCFAVSREKTGDYTIRKPDWYEYYRQQTYPFWPEAQLSWLYSHPITLEPQEGTIDPLISLNDNDHATNKRDLFNYRKIYTDKHMRHAFKSREITLVNWPQNDYWIGPIFEVPDTEAAWHREQAKELSRCFLYWLQTEASRADGRKGYPELKPCGDALGTKDGFAMRPYIRESRRIVPLFQVTEAHVGYDMRAVVCKQKGLSRVTAQTFQDSIGVGYYRIDLHPSTGKRNYIDIESLPFQIPLGSLIPQRTKNLLAAAKNIGTTHITTGCYRLHPVEWNIGESAGYCAAFCLDHQLTPAQLYADKTALENFQGSLKKAGVELQWRDELLEGLHSPD